MWKTMKDIAADLGVSPRSIRRRVDSGLVLRKEECGRVYFKLEPAKACSRCNKNKPLTVFNRDSSRSSGYRSACKECERPARAARDYKRRLAAQRFVYRYLTKNACVTCGEDNPVVLEFDHVDPSEKNSNLARMVSLGAAYSRINQEIAKCQVLCANCHRKKTAKDFGYFSHRMGLEKEGVE